MEDHHLDSNAFCLRWRLRYSAEYFPGCAGIADVTSERRRNTEKERTRSSAGRARHRLRNALVVAEISLSLVLAGRSGVAGEELYRVDQRE